MSKSKIQVETDNSNWQAPKKRKPRKPMKRQCRQRFGAFENVSKAVGFFTCSKTFSSLLF